MEQHILLDETPEHFHVQHPDGRRFKLIKSELPPEAHEAIREHFARGGQVRQSEANAEYQIVDHGNGRRFKVHKSLLPKMAEGGDTSDVTLSPDGRQAYRPSQYYPKVEAEGGPVPEGGSTGLPYQNEINAAASKYNIHPAILRGMIRTESNFDPQADANLHDPHSHAGGLMQVQPGTAASLGYDPDLRWDPATNIDMGAKYLRQQIDAAHGDVAAGIQKYHDGPDLKGSSKNPNYANTVLGRAADYGYDPAATKSIYDSGFISGIPSLSQVGAGIATGIQGVINPALVANSPAIYGATKNAIDDIGSSSPAPATHQPYQPPPPAAPYKPPELEPLAPQPQPPGTEAQEAAVLSLADAQKELSGAQQGLLDEQNNARQQAWNDAQQRLKKDQEIGDNLFSSIVNGRGKIDPENYFEPTEEGGAGHSRLLSAISVGLGGFAQGLIGGNNPALQYLNQAIDRNVDAQKFNIQNKNNLYNMFLNRTHNDQQAYLFTQAALNDIAAGKMAEMAQKYNNPIIQANAEKAIADLRQNAAQQRYQADLQAPAWKLQQMQLRQQELQMRAIQQLSQGGASNGEPDYSPYLLQTYQERQVRVTNPDGSQGPKRLFATKEDAELYKKNDAELKGVDNQISGLKYMLSSNPRGGWPFTGTREQIKSATNALSTQLSGLYGLNRLTEVEYRTYQSQLDDIGALINPSRGIAQLDALQKIIAQKRAAYNSAYAGGAGGPVINQRAPGG